MTTQEAMNLGALYAILYIVGYLLTLLGLYWLIEGASRVIKRRRDNKARTFVLNVPEKDYYPASEYQFEFKNQALLEAFQTGMATAEAVSGNDRAALIETSWATRKAAIQ